MGRLLLSLLSTLALACGGSREDAEVAAAGVPTAGGPPAYEPAGPLPARAITTRAPSVAALDPLLDLLPTDPVAAVVVRDPLTLFDEIERITEGQQGAWTTLVARELELGRLRELPDVAAWRTAWKAAGIGDDHGLAFALVGGAWVAVVAADDPARVREQMRALLPESKARTAQCVRVQDVAGRVACSYDGAALEAYRPARGAARSRAALERALGAGIVERSNVVALRSIDRAALAIATTPGWVQLDVGLGSVVEVDPFGRPGPATTLGSLQAGQSFLWMRLDPKAVARAVGGSKVHTTIAAGLTGEAIIYSPGAEPGLAIVVGLAQAKVAPALMESVASIVHASLGPSEIEDVGDIVTRRAEIPQAQIAAGLEGMGMVGEARWFTGERWGAFLVGIPASLVRGIADANPSPPASELLDVLPVEMSAALRDGSAASALHIELDGLQAPALREGVGVIAGPTSPWFSDAAKLTAGLDLLASVSSVSVWTTHANGNVGAHVAVRLFGDGHTDDGRAAHAARVAVVTGARTAAAAYEELTREHRASPRLSSFIARAGENGDNGLYASAMQLAIFGSLLRAVRRVAPGLTPTVPFDWLGG